MISFLISLAPFLPMILNVAAFFMKLFGSSADTIKEYEAMVKKLSDDGSLSLQSHDRLLAHKDAILKRLKEKEVASSIKPIEPGDNSKNTP